MGYAILVLVLATGLAVCGPAFAFSPGGRAGAARPDIGEDDGEAVDADDVARIAGHGVAGGVASGAGRAPEAAPRPGAVAPRGERCVRPRDAGSVYMNRSSYGRRPGPPALEGGWGRAGERGGSGIDDTSPSCRQDGVPR